MARLLLLVALIATAIASTHAISIARDQSSCDDACYATEQNAMQTCDTQVCIYQAIQAYRSCDAGCAQTRVVQKDASCRTACYTVERLAQNQCHGSEVCFGEAQIAANQCVAACDEIILSAAASSSPSHTKDATCESTCSAIEREAENECGGSEVCFAEAQIAFNQCIKSCPSSSTSTTRRMRKFNNARRSTMMKKEKVAVSSSSSDRDCSSDCLDSYQSGVDSCGVDSSCLAEMKQICTSCIRQCA